MLALLVCPLTGQLANTKAAITEIRRSKIILGLTGDEHIDRTLRIAVDSFWRVGRLTEEMPYEEALQAANDDDRTMVLYVDNMKSETRLMQNQFDNGGVPTMNWLPGPSSQSLILTVSDGKRLKRDMKAFLALPTDEDGLVPEAAIYFGVAALNDMCMTVARAPKSGAAHLKATLAKRGRRLKAKTLYVLDELIDKKLTQDVFADIYGFQVEVVDFETWSEVVLNRQAGAAYAIVSPVPMGGRHVYAHYLMDAETGLILGVAYPKVAVALGPINLSKSNSATINEKMAELYHEAAASR
ncbi:hypothetical protein [Neolewinella xylanilytica]|nr:hypothetical protein [Neolewinella xylanilytica]